VSLLNEIHIPEGIKKLDLNQMQQLATEIREQIIETVSKTGGHLAPNLGVVELTLALHAVFDTPKDQIVWDVGHQAYVHKLLTGRQKEFKTLRQYKGLSGFPKRSESPHDVFDAGHSSTSISGALGLAKARDLKDEKYKVIAVIGDGAMTGGMAFEALNHAGHLGLDLIVILNDNEMSIAANVGALSSYLNRLRTDPKYYRGKEGIRKGLQKIPAIGNKVIRAVEKAKDGLKYALVPGAFFEELGFTYIGPIDGHNLGELKQVLQQAKSKGGPILVHAITTKGKGYKPAQENPDRFHGVGPFNVETGELIKKGTTASYTQVFGDALVELGKENPSIVAITAAMPDSTGLGKFAKAFPTRFLDVGIAEQHAVTMAAGLALQGFKPVVAVYSTFFQRAYDQILHDVCLQNAPVVLAIDRAGVVGDDGPTHHGVFDIAFLRHIPNLVIMAPKDENELRHMLKTAVEYPGPVALRYPRASSDGLVLDKKLTSLPIGKAELLREGTDATILGVGTTLKLCLAAAEELAKEGISVAVINPRFIKPLDGDRILFHAKRTGTVITVEDHVLAGGFGSAVIELFQDNNLQVPVIRIGYPDVFVEQGPITRLREDYGISVRGIADGVRGALNGKG
jgi:1-deoxy-D-xylulose-5-phosphate synthase